MQRAAIQAAMLNLVACYKFPELHAGHRAEQFGILSGIAFSLWRAAFLASLGVRPYLQAHGSAEDPPSQSAHAADLLRTVLTTNAVSFVVDQKTQYWMGQYYIDNAGYRLDEYIERWGDIVPANMQRFRQMWNGAEVSPDYVESARAWMHIFNPFVDLVRALMKEIGVAALSEMIPPDPGNYKFHPRPASLSDFFD